LISGESKYKKVGMVKCLVVLDCIANVTVYVPSTSDVCDGVHSIVVAYEYCSCDAESRCLRDIESTVTIHNTRIVAIKTYTLLREIERHSYRLV